MTGYKGFYYHFLDMVSGKRVWTCELSTIDSALLLAGMLTAAEYFRAKARTSAKSASSPTRSIVARIGTGRKTAE